jgi:hypothetical protein
MVGTPGGFEECVVEVVSRVLAEYLGFGLRCVVEGGRGF